MNQIATRTCVGCRLQKPLTEYYSRGHGKRHSRCRACFAEDGRWYCRLRKYGITKAQYMALRIQQYGRCAVCREADDNLRVDHCHRTGKIRQLLCHRCNATIGFVDDDIAILHEAIAYIVRHKMKDGNETN